MRPARESFIDTAANLIERAIVAPRAVWTAATAELAGEH
jgi:hypothetical protein